MFSTSPSLGGCVAFFWVVDLFKTTTMKKLIFLLVILMPLTSLAQRPKIDKDKVDPFDGSRMVIPSRISLGTYVDNKKKIVQVYAMQRMTATDTTHVIVCTGGKAIGCCGTGKGYIRFLYEDDSNLKLSELDSDIDCSDWCGEMFKLDSWEQLSELKLIRYAQSDRSVDLNPNKRSLDMLIELMNGL